jgi:hypothetical protein
MRRLFSALAVLIGFAIVSGLCGCVTQGERLMPITWEIVEEAKDRTHGDPETMLKQLNYYLSAPLTLIKNDQNRDFRPINGILHIEEKNKLLDTKIPSSYMGELHNFNYDNESFVILFKEGNAVDVQLRFIRDKEKNWFVLDSVVDSPENYALSSDGIRPYLCIKLDYRNEKYIPIYQNISSATQDSPTQPSRNILGKGILTKESIVLYIKSKNTSISSNMLEKIVNTYIVEANAEKVNPDIAIAQMCEGTNFLNNLNRLSSNNPGDLQDIINTKLRASFPSMEDGIRVHIQQLKYYASLEVFAYPPVDQPRLKRVEKNHGKYPTLDQLFSVWVSKNHAAAYRNSINIILSEMYNFQNSRK